MATAISNQPQYDPDRSWTVIVAILLFMVLVTMCSCRSRKVVTDATHDTCYVASVDTITRHDTAVVVAHQRDSIYLHDSVYYSVITRGDTVFVDKYVEKTAYKDRVKHDSIYLHTTDTLIARDTIYKARTDTTTVTKEVERPLTRWQQFKQSMGVFFMGVLALMAVLFVWKNWARIKWW